VSKAIFPVRRFRGIGLSREDVATLQGAFDRSDASVQKIEVDHLKSLSSARLREYAAARLERLADRGTSDDEEVEADTGQKSALSKPSGKVVDSPDSDNLSVLTGEDSSTLKE
jgi:hypothetical protein